jgi:hypothetical protein
MCPVAVVLTWRWSVVCTDTGVLRVHRTQNSQCTVRPPVRKNWAVFGGVGWDISVHIFVFVYVVTLTIWIFTCGPWYGYMLHIYEILPSPREKGEKLSQGRAQADRVRSGMRRLSGEDDMLLFFLQCFNIFCRGRMPVPSLEIASRVLLSPIEPGF